MIAHAFCELCDSEWIAHGIVDIESGEVFNVSDILNMPESKDIYIDDLSILYIYLVRALLAGGAQCTGTNKPLKSGFFRIVISKNACANIVFNIKNCEIRIIDWTKKFGQPMPERLKDAKRLLSYAEKSGRTRAGLGSDAYNEFLHTLYTKKDSENANYALIREIFPSLPWDFDSAKETVIGYQIARPGMYNNVYSYDIKRAYAFSMCGDTPEHAPELVEGFKKPRGNQWAIFICSYAGKKLKEGAIPFLPDEEKTSGVAWIPQRLFTLVDQTYSFDFFHVSQTMLFKTRKSLFRRFVNKNYGSKDPLILSYNKVIVNSLVGYLGRRRRSTRDIFKLDKNCNIERKAEICPLEPIYTPAYINILDRHKFRFLTALRAIGIENVIYANTDGFFTLEPINLDRLNDSITGELGKVELRRIYSRMRINAINAYVGEYDGPEGKMIDTTISGLRFIDDNLTPDRFESGDITYYIDSATPEGTMRRHYFRALSSPAGAEL